jgi:hypothetical protein
MWLAGGNMPDFRTINRFRGVVMKGEIREVFTGVLELLIKEGYVIGELFCGWDEDWSGCESAQGSVGKEDSKVQGTPEAKDPEVSGGCSNPVSRIAFERKMNRVPGMHLPERIEVVRGDICPTF